MEKKVGNELFRMIGMYKNCDSYSIGEIKGDRTGILFTHSSEKDREECLEKLFSTGCFSPGPDGLFFYHGVLVELRVE